MIKVTPFVNPFSRKKKVIEVIKGGKVYKKVVNGK